MKKKLIFLTSTAWEIGRWENWEGDIPQKGDIIFDESFPKQFWNCHVECRVFLANKPEVVKVFIR